MLTTSYLGSSDQGVAIIVVIVNYHTQFVIIQIAIFFWQLDDANCGNFVDSKLVLELAICKSHHYRIVLFILVQSMTCSNSKIWLTVRRNCSQLFLFSLSRDQHYLRTLNNELFGGVKSKENLVRAAYIMSQEDCKQENSNYFYLWINSGMNVPFVSNFSWMLIMCPNSDKFQSDQMRRGLLNCERKIIYRVHNIQW